MASGHVNRANRPNTWLLRPMLQREDSSCQPGAVHTWPLADVTLAAGDVCCGGKADVTTGPSSACDPSSLLGKSHAKRLLPLRLFVDGEADGACAAILDRIISVFIAAPL